MRDLLVGKKPKDFDVVTDATPRQIKKIFSNCRLIGRRFRLAHVYFSNQDFIEVATFRSNPPEEDDHSERHLEKQDGLVLKDNLFGTPEEDALRRDFTVNAMFYDIRDFSIIDYAGGLEDIEKRSIRCIGDPPVRYAEDPVRMLRAVRFAASIGLEIEQETFHHMCEMSDRIQLVAKPRLYDEMLKIIYSGGVEKAFELLEETGMLQYIFEDWFKWKTETASAVDKEWITKALRQFDKWKAHDVKARPDLLLALLFGSYHESLAAGESDDDGREGSALAKVITSHHAKLCQRMIVPKKDLYDLVNITACQNRFGKTAGKQPYKFSQRHYFPSAYAYFKFAHSLTGRSEEIAEWWTEYMANEYQPHHTQRYHQNHAPRRRKRRPGGRG